MFIVAYLNFSIIDLKICIIKSVLKISIRFEWKFGCLDQSIGNNRGVKEIYIRYRISYSCWWQIDNITENCQSFIILSTKSKK